jgi:TonB family protein
MNRLVITLILSLLCGIAVAEPDPAATEIAAPEVEPELIHFAEAAYPPEALRAGLEGTVLLELLVTAAGTVDSVLVIQPLSPELDAAARVAAAQCRFSPALAAGEAVPVYLQFAYTFSLAEAARILEPVINLAGTVREMATDQPVAGAMVTAMTVVPDTAGLALPLAVHLERIGGFEGQYLEGRRLVTFADSTGAFAFRSLVPGTVELTFPNAGYAPLTIGENLAAGERVDLEARLQRTAAADFEIVVYGQAPEKEVTRRSLSVSEVERIPGFGGDAIRSVQALPGVARPTLADPSAVVVRGSGNYDTRFLLDGIDIPLLFHFGGVKSTYNSLSLGSVDLYPGGFGTGYGGCVGGIVELTGRRARYEDWRTIIDVSLLDGSVHTEGPLGDDWGFMFSARRSFIGELAEAAFKNNDDVSFAVAPYYWDIVSRLDWEPNPNHTLFLTAFAASDKLGLVANDAASGSAEVSEAQDEVNLDLFFSRYILGWDAIISDTVQNKLRASYGRSRDYGQVLGEFRFEGKGPVYNLRNNLSWDARHNVTANFGADFIYSPYTYEVKVSGYPTSELEGKKYSDLGWYANVDWRPIDELLITPGVRYDYYHHLDEGHGDVRLAGRWNYRKGRTLTASAGTYNQAPQPLGQSTDPVYGNPDLPPTLATHLTLGHEWSMGNGLSLKVEGYYNTQDQVPALADTNDANFLADAEARMYGLEFMLRKDKGDGNFFGWLAYSLGRSERRFARDPGSSGMNWDPDTWYLHDIDQTHHIQAVGSWDLGNNWSFGSRLQYVTGVPLTPIVGSEFDADYGSYEPIEGEYLSDRVEPYFRMDLRVDKTFYKKNSIWSVYLDLQNANYFVYNSPEGYTYNYDYTKRTDFGYIFVPALGLRVEF